MLSNECNVQRKTVMKKNLIITLAVSLLTLAGCAKDHNCRCVTTEAQYPTETMVNADKGLSCSKITRLGFERQLGGKLVRNMEAVECEDFVEEDQQ